MKYEDFIAQKRLVAPATGFDEVPALNPKLFPFQADIVRWALRRGRAAIWADCGLGKTWMELDWARAVAEYDEDDRPALILTPLAVAQQFVTEGAKMGIGVTHARDQSGVAAGVNVTNYERLHLFDPDAFGAIVLDESSALKDYTSATRNAVIEAFARCPFRLGCSATPAPNDHMELGNHAEFLGVMSRTEMLAMFFVHDGGSTQDWRLKGHAVREFWRWVCSWAVAIRSPADLGYSDEGFVLPPLTIAERVVSVGTDFARAQGTLFAVEARGLSEQRDARRSSLLDRVKVAAEIVNAEPNEPWLIWCDLNAESEALTAAIPGAVELTGSMDNDTKESLICRVLLGCACDKRQSGTERSCTCGGRIRVLVSKPSICGQGINAQHCARVVFVGLSHSFEAWYQAIRRVYRFGQRREVKCWMITSDAEGAVVTNLKRKQADAAKMVTGMVAEMSQFANVKSATRDVTEYRPIKKMTIPGWVGTEDAT